MKTSKVLSLIAIALLASVLLISCSSDTGYGTYIPPQSSEPSWKSDPEASAFIEEIGGCSDTYTGTVSEESYSVADDAAKAFVSNEVISADSECSIIDVKREKKLNKSEISSLGISDELMKGADEVVKYSVTYTETENDDASVISLAISSSDRCNITVYIIRYADMYKYFTPAVTNENTLTKSYYDSIFNSQKYANCTLTSSSEISVQADYLDIFISYTVSTSSTIMFDNDRIYLTQTARSSDTSLFQNSDVTLYIERNGDSIDCYILSNGTWQSAQLSSLGDMFDLSSIEDLRPFAQFYLDHSYFTKTDYGCTLGEENLAKFSSAVFDLAIDQLLGTEVDDYKCEGSVDYYVSNGVLSGTRSNLFFDVTVMGVTVKETITAQDKCINYGTTVVENPLAQ